MRLAIYHADAFARRRFAGNPAAVMPLDAWLPDETLQAIAAENNLSETAFVVREGQGWQLRWFTPGIEVPLCGHATLATALVMRDRLGLWRGSIAFETRSGTLEVSEDEDRLVLDFPAQPPRPVAAPAGLAQALGATPSEVLQEVDLVCVFAEAGQVRALEPDFRAIARIDVRSIVVTAPGDPGDCDFVSRFFAPRGGVDEDPVTGSAHCKLIPYWSRRLGKTRLFARQVSRRGGELWCEDRGARVRIAGHGAIYLEGSVEI
jgi:PhzF family phenazine biosynthesis protein